MRRGKHPIPADDTACPWCGLDRCTTPVECDHALEQREQDDAAYEAEARDLMSGDYEPEFECDACGGAGGGVVGEDEVLCDRCGGSGILRAWSPDDDDDGFSPPDPDDRPEWSDADQTRWENANIYEPKER